MAGRATFTSEQLSVAWVKQANATPKGNRHDVVADLMGQMNMDVDDEDCCRKVYNNVTQRIKKLAEKRTIPKLEPGKKGARTSPEEDARIDAIFAKGPEEKEETLAL